MKKFIKQTEYTNKTISTSYLGFELKCNKHILTCLFGEPTMDYLKGTEHHDKINAEWVWLKDEKVITIYDYKDSAIYNEWHIGAKKQEDIIEFLNEQNIHCLLKVN